MCPDKCDENQKEKDVKTARMTFPQLKFTVVKNDNNFCYHNYKVGDEFILKDFTHAPEHFCLAITHAAFPAMHTLTFGGRFPFMENTASLVTTCPDGGKMAFKIELLDKDGKVVVVPQKEKPTGPKPKKMLIEVEHSDNTCHYGYKVGDKWEVTGLRTPDGMCGAAYHLLFPVLFEMNFGATFSFEKNPNCKTGITCPDGGKIKFKVTRIDE
ncbi:MAG: TIGR04076 family protein [Candidatus Omnitrophica bacterium]|nr:TIGR04076 family protein [Candidatus Omnitrophota bacterium]